MTEENTPTAEVENTETPEAAAETAEAKVEAAPEAKEAEAPAETESEEVQEASGEEKPKPKRSRAEERIKALNARAKEAEARADQFEREKKAAERKLAALDSAEPKVSDYEDGEFDPRYIADLAVHKAAQRGKSEVEEDAKRAGEDSERATEERQQAVFDAFNERVDDFREHAPDFDEVALDPKLPFSGMMQEMVLESDLGPQVAYYLGKNPKECAQIARMKTEREVARNIGRIEAKITPAKPRKITTAPEPIKPVAESGATLGVQPNEMNWKEMQDHFRKQGVI